MDLCELVRDPQTADSTVERAAGWARHIGRTPMIVEREVDGFIVNRILGAASGGGFQPARRGRRQR